MIKWVITLLLLWQCLLLRAFTLSGMVTNTRGEPLPYVNIYIVGTTNGTSANADGFYTLELAEGKHDVAFQYIGYKQQVKTIEMLDNKTLNVVLEVLQYDFNELVINANEDPAVTVIKKAIARRKYFLNAVENYSCDAYVKGVQRITDLPFWAEKRLKKAGIVPGKNGVVYLSESASKLYYKKPDKFHEVVYSSKVSGRSQGFTYNSAQDFFFNFYERSITIEGLAPRPLISPLSESAFSYYKYKMLGAYREGDKLINKIQVTPRRKADPCFTGVLSIVEDNWNIHSLELFVTKDNGIQFLDTLRITQYFLPVKNDLWLASQQRYDANLSFLGVKGDGYYLGIFKNYRLNEGFAQKKDSTTSPPKPAQQKRAEKRAEKKIFTAEIIKVEESANKRDVQYWDSVRPIPLTALESEDYIIKDSIQTIRDSKSYKDSTDRQLNKPGIMSFLTGYTFRKQYRKISIRVPSLLGVLNFNTVEGPVLQLKFSVQKAFDKDRSRISVEPVFRYGFTNKQWGAMATVNYRISQKRDEYFVCSGGKFVSQFNEVQPQPIWGNTWESLVMRLNFTKLYQQYFARVTYGRELYNGIYGALTVNYAKREPLENTNQFSFFPKVRNRYTPNGMDLPGLRYDTDNINPHSSFRVDVRLRFVFGQKVVNRPDFTIRTQSKFPVLTLNYKRAIAIKGFSDLDYDFLEAQLSGNIPMKQAGVLFYRFGGGGFATSKRVEFTDYKHFFGNFLTTGQTDQLGFFTIRYYRHSTREYFTEAHLEHHFDGLLFSRIPGFRKLKLEEVLGFHFLYTPVRKQYFQLDVGIENILKVMRVDFVTGFGSGKNEYYFGGRIGLALDFD